MSQLLQNNDFVVGHLTPSIVLYEPSFEGGLSAVFYVYAYKLQDDESLQLIAQDCYVPSLISQSTSIAANEDKAERVLIKLNQLLGRSGMRNILWGFLSEKDNKNILPEKNKQPSMIKRAMFFSKPVVKFSMNPKIKRSIA